MKKWTRLLAMGLTAGACGLTLTACSNSASSNGKQNLTWMEKTEIETMDPSKATDATSADQLNNTMENFYRLGKDSTITPGMAKKTQVSKDGRTWIFTLRKNAKWSNGDPVQAKDWVYSWRRTVNPKTGSQYSYLFTGIHNANQIVAGKKPVDSLGIHAEGKYKVRVNLDRRIPYFKLLMGFMIFDPQDPNAVAKFGKRYGTASKYQVYDGPFVEKGWTGSNLSWKLVKNPHYWDKKAVKLNAIDYSVQKTPSTDYNLYQSGKLDAALLSPQASKELKNQKGYTVRKASSTIYMEDNLAKKNGLRNTDLRRAMSMAIDRKGLVKAIGGASKPATTFSAEGMTKVNGKDFADLVRDSSTNQELTYNPKLARVYYKKALKQLGKKKLSFGLLSYDDDASKKGAEFIQSSLEDNLKGLTINVTSIPKKAALNRGTSGNFDLFLMGWNADFTDPISFLQLCTTHNSYNWGKWSNKEYDRLIAASEKTGNTAARWQDLVKAERILINDQGETPLYYQQEAWMVRPDVKGVIYNGAGSNYNFKDAYIAK